MVYRTLYRFEELGEAGLSDRRLHAESRKVTPEIMNYLFSLLDTSGRVIQTYSRSKCSGLFLSLLEKMKVAYRRAEKLHLVLDNCIIYKSKRTLAWLRQFGDRFVLHFLPPCSPEHNVIERLWKQMHDHVTRNHRHRTMKDLLGVIEQFLRNIQPSPGTKVSLLTMAA